MDSSKQSDDALHATVSWEPLNLPQTSFDVRTLSHVIDNDNKLMLRTTFLAFVVGILLTLFGLGRTATSITEASLLGLFFGILFFVAGVVLIYQFCTPIMFDKDRSLVSRFRLRSKLHIKFTSILALQIIKTLPKSDSGDNYELIAVKKSGERVGLVQYANKKNALRDAERLAQFIDVKLLHRLT